MPIALVLITIGGLMVYSAIHGITELDVLRGAKGSPIDPSGGTPVAPSAAIGDPLAGQPGGFTGADSVHHTFSGPNADLLHRLANIAVHNFHLVITSTYRSPSHNATVGGAAQSMHLQNRAFDAAGKPVDKSAFARYVWQNYSDQVAEVYYAPAGITGKNGHNYFPMVFDNPTMVHVSA